MARYYVTFHATASHTVEVEAENKQHAYDKAWEVGPPSGPCHQEDFDLGDWDIEYLEEAD